MSSSTRLPDSAFMASHLSRLVAAALVALLASGCMLTERVRRVVLGPPTGVDLNEASEGALADLSGVTERDAERIVLHRPYVEKADVVRRGVVSRKQFEKFAARVYVSRPESHGTVEVEGAVPGD